MEYRVIKAEGSAELERAVAEAMADGWQPQGGVAFQDCVEPTDMYLQAMVRSEPSASAIYEQVERDLMRAGPVAGRKPERHTW